MGSSIRGETNVKFTKNRVKHQASDDMKLFATLTGLIAANTVPYYPSTGYDQTYAAPASPMGGMNSMLPLLLLSDNKSSSSTSNLLPLMLMGGMGGGDAGGMMGNPIMMYFLLKDDKTSSSSSMDSLLPLMMMGGMGGDPNNPMSSMLPLLLLGDDYKQIDAAATAAICNPASTVATLTTAQKNDCNVAATKYNTDAAGCTAMTDATQKATCVAGLKATELAIYTAAGYSKSNSNDLLMMMMMGGMGGAGGAGNMMLPLMMMQQPVIDPATGQSTGGMFGGGAAAGGMDPLMMMLMLE